MMGEEYEKREMKLELWHRGGNEYEGQWTTSRNGHNVAVFSRYTVFSTSNTTHKPLPHSSNRATSAIFTTTNLLPNLPLRKLPFQNSHTSTDTSVIKGVASWYQSTDIIINISHSLSHYPIPSIPLIQPQYKDAVRWCSNPSRYIKIVYCIILPVEESIAIHSSIPIWSDFISHQNLINRDIYIERVISPLDFSKSYTLW